MELPFGLLELARQVTGEAPRGVTPMPGGASTRQFFRVDLGGRSAVGMYVPDEMRPDGQESQRGQAGRWPFLEVQALLTDRGIRVPALLGSDCPRGWMLVEDLGDDTLGAWLERRPQDRETLYLRAVLDLARAQVALAELPADSVVLRRAFDHKLLRWELDHFREYGVLARGIRLEPELAQGLELALAQVTERIAELPRGFVHRDYQSRNLMVLPGPNGLSLAWVDFQDAMLGPRAYDLVALLCDSYQPYDPNFVQRMLDAYGTARGLTAEDRRALGLEHALVTLQRKLKDAGRFWYLAQVKQKPELLPYYVPTLGIVRGALGILRGQGRLPDSSLDCLEAVLQRCLA